MTSTVHNWRRMNTKATMYINLIKKHLPTISFVGGFIWDNLTLRRIDRLSDQLFLLGYLLILMIFISLGHLIQQKVVKSRLLVKYADWFPEIIQFCLGSLFSAYVVYYFKSASFSKTAIFLAIIVALLIANEHIKDRLTNLLLQMALLFFSCFSFLIFFLPIIFKKMNVWLFLAGGFFSLLITLGLLLLLYYFSAVRERTQLQKASILVSSLYLLFTLFYFLNWIPPVPLSLKFTGIYHKVVRAGDFYEARYRRPVWYRFYRASDQPFIYQPGDSVFCFTSVFAPTALKKQISHHWYQDQPGKGWVHLSKISYPMTGGRDGGFRGYTFKRSVSPGAWRVDIKTEDDLLIGRISFDIVEADTTTPYWRVKPI